MIPIPSQFNPVSVFTTDVNGDHHGDLVAANSYMANIAVYVNDGAGNLDPPIYYGTRNWPGGVFVRDFDGDLDNDLLTFFPTDKCFARQLLLLWCAGISPRPMVSLNPTCFRT